MRKMYLVSATVIGAAFGGWAKAGDLISNGGFETGSPGSHSGLYNSWTFSPGGGFGDDAGIAAAVDANYPHSNTPPHGQVAFISDIASISQSFTVTADGKYSFSFNAAAPDPNNPFPYDPGTIHATLTGGTLGNTIFLDTGPLGGSFAPYSLSNISLKNGLTYTLTLSQSSNSPSADNAALIDDVSVPTLAPEPGTAALLVTAAGGALLRRRRR